MANKNLKTRKPLSAAGKGFICLALLLALTVFASYLALAGLPLDSEGVNVLLPWVPVSGNWVKSLPVERGLGGGTYAEYTYTLPEGASETALDDAVKVIKNRLDQMGETDASVAVQGDVIRLELRKMAQSRLASVLSMGTVNGHFVFADANGNTVLTENDIKQAVPDVTYNNNRTSYTVSLKFTVNEQGRQKLDDAKPAYLSVTVDGASVASRASISGDTISCVLGYNSATYYTTAANVAFMKNFGSVDVNLSQRGVGDVPASSGTVLRVILILSAVLLACALVYLIFTGKLTGIAAFLSVWCAVVLGLFLVATLVVPAVVMLKIGSLVAIVLGILLAVYTAVSRTDAISRQIGEGSMPKQATKLGFRAVLKHVWIVHGVCMAVALVLMIFSFSRAIGYTLAAMVFSSAVAMLVMRAYQWCFTMISSKPSLFGKAK